MGNADGAVPLIVRHVFCRRKMCIRLCDGCKPVAE
jgi:hypothetical protein